jgi:1,4-alpha-glucan branching enzyme
MERVGINFVQQYLPPKKQVEKEQKSTDTVQLFSGNIKKPNLNNLQATFLTRPSTISFGRKLEEHFSWGANVLPDGKVSFKIWAPYAESVKLEVRDKNTPPQNDHTNEEANQIVMQFRSNDPDAAKNFQNYKVDELKQNKWMYHFGKEENAKKVITLENKGNGIFEAITDGVNPGDMYRFKLHKNVNGQKQVVPIKDPATKSQPFDTHGWSEVIDDNYDWGKKEALWQKQYKEKRLKDPNAPYGSLLPPSDMVVEQVHVGTFTDEGTYESMMKKLDTVAKQGVANTIHILPVGEFYGQKDWGYDLVDINAPESSYVGDKKQNAPKVFKDLIKRAHELGLAVVIDVVYNHWGPNFTVVQECGPYMGKDTPWGAGYNFEGKDGGKEVRDFAVDNALNWLVKYHADGLRLDMTKFMYSDLAIKDIAFEVRKHKPEAVLIAEDSRDYPNLVKPIDPKTVNPKDDGQVSGIEALLEKARKAGDGYIDVINNSGYMQELGFDAHWNFGLVHTLSSLATNSEVMGYKPEHGIRNLENIYRYGYKWANKDMNLPPTHTLMSYSMSHDEAGNLDGTRLISKIMNSKLGMFGKVNHHNHGLNGAQAGQKAAQVTQSLLEAYVTGDDKLWKETLSSNNLPADAVNKDHFGKILEEAKAMNKVSQGMIWMFPGPKMFLQGDIEGDISTFKYFRDTPVEGLVEHISSDKDKGYSIGNEAFMQSKIGQPGKQIKGIEEFNKDIARLFKANKALHTGNNKNLDLTCHNGGNNMIAIHRFHKNENGQKEGKEFFAIANYGTRNFNKDYEMHFPKGEWKLVLSSNDQKYGVDAAKANQMKQFQSQEVTGKGLTLSNAEKVKVGMPAQSFLIYEKVSD